MIEEQLAMGEWTLELTRRKGNGMARQERTLRGGCMELVVHGRAVVGDEVLLRLCQPLCVGGDDIDVGMAVCGVVVG
ncbi:hypothetical protein Tco_0857396 [Tanacetum coccineum]|uniref:Uncharacterized protein n=1 Tax=Tanacetum coccineum TaxID=301880 RepID=A0ABQ5B7Z3_9ASTR